MLSPSNLDQLLQTAIGRGDVPGVVAMAGDRQGVIYEGTFGLAETGAARAMTTDAIFKIASMTKAVTAVAAMQLVEEQRLSLDDPAARYLPELAQPMVVDSFDAANGTCRLRPAVTPITIRHLFTHTSGLGYPFTNEVLSQLASRPGAVSAAGPLLFDPGTQWLYGSSTALLGQIVETLAGQNLESCFRERIFGPLGMSDTAYNIPNENHARIVNVHRRLANGTLAEQPRQPPLVMTEFNGGGGLYSTAGDYLRFLRMLLNGGELGAARILSRESVASMGQNHIGAVNLRALKSARPEHSGDFTFVGDDRDKFGLGFQITTAAAEGRRSAGSLSWGGVNNTYFWLDPARGVAGVILMQFLPFADPKALALYEAFECGVYELLGR